jgi:hypothetical protein
MKFPNQPKDTTVLLERPQSGGYLNGPILPAVAWRARIGEIHFASNLSVAHQDLQPNNNNDDTIGTPHKIPSQWKSASANRWKELPARPCWRANRS